MKRITLLGTLLALALSSYTVQAQTDSLKSRQITYLAKELAISETTATQVENILADYKSNAKNLVAKNLDPKETRTKLDLLIADKNSKLKRILTEKQLDKLLPTTEK